jgi:hypothetical protein
MPDRPSENPEHLKLVSNLLAPGEAVEGVFDVTSPTRFKAFSKSWASLAVA